MSSGVSTPNKENKAMPALSLEHSRDARALPPDLLLVAGLIGLDVAARLMPHAPDFTPVAASALFAASILRVRVVAVSVPIIGLLAGDALLGFYDWRVMIVVYAALSLPAGAAILSRHLRRPLMVVPILASSSLMFFAATNFAVWAFSPIYAADGPGLLKCYIAALPFLRNMLAGDLFWGLVLFGGYWLAQNLRAATTAAAIAEAAAMRARP
jgi:hypothetical protein